MERQEGYYWVKVGEYSKYLSVSYYNERLNLFTTLGGAMYSASELFWIDKPENRLTPPNI